MKKSIRIVSVLMVLALAMLTMAGCGSTSEDTSASTDSSKVYQVGILQQLEHPALDQATEGFEQALKDKLGEDNVEIDLQNAQNEQANCTTIAQEFVASDVDLIMANATTALQAAAAATSEIPIVATSVTDYATALDIDDWTGATGTNVTGTSDLAPLEQQAEMILELVPDAKTVGLLYCSAEPNSIYQVEQIKSILEGMDSGITCNEYSAADSNEIQAVTTSAVSECDVIYIPTDNTMAGSTEAINNVAQPAGVPIIAGEEGICSGCGIATLTISYYDIGYAAGEMAADILLNGTDPGTMKVQTAESVTKEYNATICEALNITIPSDYVAIETEEEE